MEVDITIFTPTYNRGSEIINLYNSLKIQTRKNFEWLVVDDGSNDDTKELINKLINIENDFPIRYYYKENGGKHRAINFGSEKAKGRLFFIVDSDDYITTDAIEIILNEEKKMPINQYKLAGLGFNKGRNEHSIVGSTFSGESLIASSIERFKYNINGDKAEVFYTEILKEYKFPEFSGENFLTESVVWYKIASDGYKLKWINKTIYIFEYLDDGLTKNARNINLNNFVGFTYSIRESLDYDLTLKEKIARIGGYTRLSRIKGETYFDISDNINKNIILCIVLGWASSLNGVIKELEEKYH